MVKEINLPPIGLACFHGLLYCFCISYNANSLSNKQSEGREIDDEAEMLGREIRISFALL